MELATRFDCPQLPGKPVAEPQGRRSILHEETGPGQSVHLYAGLFSPPNGDSCCPGCRYGCLLKFLFGVMFEAEIRDSVANAYLDRVPRRYCTLT